MTPELLLGGLRVVGTLFILFLLTFFLVYIPMKAVDLM